MPKKELRGLNAVFQGIDDMEDLISTLEETMQLNESEAERLREKLAKAIDLAEDVQEKIREASVR